MKLLVDSVIVFVVMLLAAGAIARGEQAHRHDDAPVTVQQGQSDDMVALLVNLLDW